MIVLGVDPGFANFGYCLVGVGADGLRPLRAGVLRTAKSLRRLKVLAPDDEFRRAKELFSALDALLSEHAVGLVCAESMSSPRNAATIRKLGFAWGILASVCERREVALAQVSPKQLKKAVVGRIAATDEELHRALCDRFADLGAVVDCIPQTSLHEHAFDAFGAVVACSTGEVFRAFSARERFGHGIPA